MMGHRYKAHGGYEHDCVGSPGHRWRDWMVKNPGCWRFVKNQMSRRIRRENAPRHLYNQYDEEFQRVDERAAAPGVLDDTRDAEEARGEEVEGHEG